MLRFLFLLAFVVPLVAQAQVVTTDPAFPTLDQPLTVRFDATQGTGGLAGYTGDVYAHTGVLTDASSGTSDWKYVKTNWGQNTADTRLTRVSTDVYELEIADIRAYYGVPSNVDVKQLAFVFRSATAVGGSYREGKDNGGSDIFVEVFASDLNVRFAKPTADVFDPVLLGQGDTIDVLLTGSSAEGTIDRLALFVDGTLVADVADDTLYYAYTAPTEGARVTLTARVEAGGASAEDSLTVTVHPDLVDAPPPTGVAPGITEHSAGEVTLALYAPGKAFVYVLGDFNDWTPDPAYFMHRHQPSPDSTLWWLTFPVEAGTEYAFQYLVDGDIRIADPYAETLLDPNHDASIPEAVYPDLKPYPTGKGQYYVSTFQTDQAAYTWQTTDYQRPAPQDLVVYELLLRDFLAAHAYDVLVDTLDYLEALGVNAIELMPVQEFEGNDSWGYNPAFLFAPDKYYGTKDDLKAFVDAAHARGMAVILDVVLNHQTGQSPFIRLYNDGTFGPPTAENPWANRTAKHPFNVFYDMNHESKDWQYVVDRFNRFWLEEYRVDGYRFDLSKGFTQKDSGSNVGLWGAYDASRVRLLQRMADEIWAVDDRAYIILEHFADNSEETVLAEYRTDEGRDGMLLWGNLNHPYAEAVMGYHDGSKSDFSWIYHGRRGWDVPNVVGYMESHDEERIAFKTRQFGASSGSYDTADLNTTLERLKAAGAFFYTLPGPKMLWQFGEVGYDVSIDYDCRVCNKPIRWNYTEDEQRRRLYAAWAELIRLRHTYTTFTDPGTDVDLNVDGAVKRIALGGSDLNVVVVGNFGVTTQTATPGFVHGGTWYDFFSGEAFDAASRSSLTLAPGAFHVFVDSAVDFPDENLIGTPTEHTAAPHRFALDAPHPHPVANRAMLHYDTATAGPVRLDVFDSLGRRVAVLHDGWLAAGTHTAAFDGSSLPAGTYFVRLSTPTDARTTTLVLLK